MLGNSDSVIKALKDDVDTLDKINSMFDELLTKAGEKYKAEHENGQKNNTAEAVRYSIHSDSLGDYVKVDVEQNIFDNKNVREMQSIARKIINQKYKGKVLNVGVKGKAYINKRSADEYAYPANRRMDDIIKAAKMRSSTELDNLLAISKFVNNEPDDGRHPDATGGWDIYKTRFEVANIMFAGEIKIKVTDRGFIFYDITQIRRLPVNGNQTEMNSAVASGNLLNNSISDDSETVKEKLSVKSSTDNLSELKEKRSALTDEYRALRMQIDEIKESAEYVSFNDEVRAVKKNGSLFGKMEKVKEIRSRQKAWADSKGLSELEERYQRSNIKNSFNIIFAFSA